MARKLESEVERGDFSRVGRMLPLTEPMGFLQGSRKVHGNRAVTVVRNGDLDTLNGFVLENVYLPPPGYGVAVTRRSLVGWQHGWRYGVVAISEAHPGFLDESHPKLPESMYPRQTDNVLGPPPAFLRLTRHDPGASWVAVNGVVDIREPTIDRECEVDRDPLGGAEGAGTHVKCEWALYEVRVEGSFWRESDVSSPLPANMKPRQRLQVPTQRVPGVRFTTQCREFRTDTALTLEQLGDPCFGNWYRWWRDNRLFADSLRIDVGQMRIASNGQWYRRELRRGTNQEIPRHHRYRWTIRNPDGTLLRRDSTTLNPMLADLGPIYDDSKAPIAHLGKMDWGSRVLAIVPALQIGLSRSHYAMVVVDVELGPP